MEQTRVPDPMILDGVLILSAEQDGMVAAAGSQALLAVFNLCAAAYLKGVRRVMVLGPRGDSTADTALMWFNRVLTSRGLAPMAVRRIAPEGPAAQKIRRARVERDGVAKRRAVLSIQTEHPRSQPLAELQSIAAGEPGALFAATPVIAPAACIGCDACLRVCPHDVLTQINDSAGCACYRANSVACDACGLCVDVCPSDAIKVLTMSNAPADIPLTTWRCSDCGVPTRVPAIQGRDSGQCPACKANGHNKKLFQVLP